MADVKTVRKTVFNTADGPRSIVDSDGNTRVIGPGDSTEATFTQGELDNLHPDLSTTAPKPAPAPEPAPAGSTNTDATADDQARAIEELATSLANANDIPALQAMAKADKVKFETDDNKDQLALKIAQKRLGANQ